MSPRRERWPRSSVWLTTSTLSSSTSKMKASSSDCDVQPGGMPPVERWHVELGMPAANLVGAEIRSAAPRSPWPRSRPSGSRWRSRGHRPAPRRLGAETTTVRGPGCRRQRPYIVRELGIGMTTPSRGVAPGRRQQREYSGSRDWPEARWSGRRLVSSLPTASTRVSQYSVSARRVGPEAGIHRPQVDDQLRHRGGHIEVRRGELPTSVAVRQRLVELGATRSG